MISLEFNLQTCRPVCMSFTLEGHGEHYVPIPSNANLKKERPVYIFFMLEGHGDHYSSYAVGYCIVDGWVDRWCTDVSWVWRKPNRNAAALLPKATYATTSYCTEVFKYYNTKGPEFYTTTYAAPSHYTDALKYYSAPTTHTAPSYYTEAPRYYSVLSYYLHLPKYYSVPSCYTKALADYFTETVECYSEAAKRPITTKDDAIPTCYTKAALSCYVEQKYFTDAPVHYTTTYAAPSYYTYVPNDVFLVWWKPNCNAAAFFYTTYATTSSCTEVFKCYTTNAPEFYTTTYAGPSHYTDALKYYSALSYYTI
ncbi:hypothetical protein DAPPUDRAFT_240061 [Daphnia pulex]|uniref:Uncharacterized protein n=1 Tax=Daphnia pulex TaxID=6669 RepID=E9GAS4_DAPPU|nr:hypothetical protein DAPPUDRAFT_240061 [Daphnia pulex]|eukprot:EFX83308.1 hypothetical protein DAPPUDRAFT_240061 [Daphnia pulex]